MTERIELELGARPWAPSRAMRMVHELNFYDMPTEGILKKRFRPAYYFFACVDGVATEYNLWVYTRISRAEAQRLKRLRSDDLRRFEARLLVDRKLTVAVANEDQGILHRALVTVSDPLRVEESKIASQAWQTVQEDIKAEAGAIARMAYC
ncbi:hypothetical protein [Streptomyces showdoensis]|uniref:Uncharacterized protein n=1 Tax=Streptomyces showdoensis TaxID=68268 RepID=A0A2P2GKX1_STREW|nr:hypothetical protein [Streptomyces showdoensis]KKZ72163.1 hypothetical protein VO63_19395 [Streptomyces showdoensis]